MNEMKKLPTQEENKINADESKDVSNEKPV